MIYNDIKLNYGLFLIEQHMDAMELNKILDESVLKASGNSHIIPVLEAGIIDTIVETIKKFIQSIKNFFTKNSNKTEKSIEKQMDWLKEHANDFSKDAPLNGDVEYTDIADYKGGYEKIRQIKMPSIDINNDADIKILESSEVFAKAKFNDFIASQNVKFNKDDNSDGITFRDATLKYFAGSPKTVRLTNIDGSIKSIYDFIVNYKTTIVEVNNNMAKVLDNTEKDMINKLNEIQKQLGDSDKVKFERDARDANADKNTEKAVEGNKVESETKAENASAIISTNGETIRESFTGIFRYITEKVEDSTKKDSGTPVEGSDNATKELKEKVQKISNGMKVYFNVCGDVHAAANIFKDRMVNQYTTFLHGWVDGAKAQEETKPEEKKEEEKK